MLEINDIEELPEGIFLVNLNLIKKYQRTEPIIIDKCKYGTYHKGYFHGGINIDLSLITCNNKIVIPSKIQSYVLHSYHMYILHPGMYRTEAMICQHLYWTDIRYFVQKEVTHCDTCQHTKLSNKEYGKLPAKLA